VATVLWLILQRRSLPIKSTKLPEHFSN
jgi:hypothetical protein